MVQLNTLESMLAQIGSGLSNKKPNALMYVPEPQQYPFHTSQKNGRQMLGGNRSGKTTTGVVEDVWWLTDTHPYRSTPKPPVKGRLCTVDFKNGVNKIIKPALRQWIPPSYLINGSWEDSWNGQSHTLTFANDSELELMSYEQDLDKFAGVPRHFIHFDEEPPKDIFGECKTRLVDYAGSWWMTMTPVDGMTWTFDEIYEISDKGQNPLVDVIKATIFGNSHLPREAIEELLEGLDSEETIIRGTGSYVAVGGLVFKHYNPESHVVPMKVPPASWTHYLSMDHGYNNPTAWYWHAVEPATGTVVTYDEHYKAEMTVSQHAEVVATKEKYYREQYGIIPYLKIADPAIKQRGAVTGLSVQMEYAQLGQYLALGQVRSVDAGLDKMNNYLRTNKWFITENCPNLQREMRKYKRASYSTSRLKEKNNKREEPQKKDDHGIDSCRYFFSYMPDLNIKDNVKKPSMSKAAVAILMKPGTTFNPMLPRSIDTNLISSPQTYHVHDEYVGEY